MNNGSPPGGDSLSLGLFTLGDLRLGVPGQWLLQALPWPAQLATVPRRQGALVGVFVHRGQMVPLVDMRRWLPWPGGESAQPDQVLLLQSGPRVVGLAVDKVQGLCRVPRLQVQPLHHDAHEEELFHSAAMLPAAPGTTAAVPAMAGGPGPQPPTASAPDMAVVALLDVPTLMRLTQAWCEAAELADGLSAQAVGDGPTMAGPQAPHALLRVGRAWLAVPADALCGVEPMPVLQPVFGSHPRLLGLARWRGQSLAVVRAGDDGSPAGLSGADAAGTALLAVIEHAGRQVGIRVDEAHAVMPLPVSGPLLVKTLVPALDAADGELQRLDCAGLVAMYAMPATPTVEASRAADARQAQAHVVVVAGQPWALPMPLLEGICDLPEGWGATAPQPTACLGHIDWKGAPVPVHDLNQLLGGPPSPPGREHKVVLMRQGTRLLGLVVERLLMLLPAHAATLTTLRRPSGSVQVLTTLSGQAADRPVRSFSLLPPIRVPEETDAALV